MEKVRVGCDGCNASLEAEELRYIVGLGHMLRYCPACADLYKDFLKATQALGAKYQHMLDEEEKELRARCLLRLTPLDFPKLMLDAKGEAITLG